MKWFLDQHEALVRDLKIMAAVLFPFVVITIFSGKYWLKAAEFTASLVAICLFLILSPCLIEWLRNRRS